MTEKVRGIRYADSKIEEIVGQAVGEASMLWIKENGIFDSTRGVKITKETVKAIHQAIKNEKPKFYPALDGYKSFEKYTNCEHKKNDELASDCRECDIAWLINRCQKLEKTLSDYDTAIDKLFGKE